MAESVSMEWSNGVHMEKLTFSLKWPVFAVAKYFCLDTPY